jgi:uncharacterized protein
MLSPALAGKYSVLKETLRSMGSVAIGYSGGVDSSLLLRVAVEVLGSKTLAVIGRSATYPEREFGEAVRFAEDVGARCRIVATEETDIRKFRENPPDRCYYCKTELFGKLEAIAREEGIAHIADGTITDDVGDFRPGMRARSEQGVRSPLLEAGFRKVDVRDLALHLGLPLWDKPSFACLSSRFPYGMEITRTMLSRVDRAETLLRDEGFRVVRVRCHDERTARVEVGENEIPRLLENGRRERVVGGLKDLGFTYVTLDLQGYRTGAMNEVLPLEERRRHSS